MAAKYDAIIVGGGHNGLVAAAYQARAGRKVLVLERREIVGGCAVTEEVWPGYRVSTGAYLTSLLPERRRAEGIGYWGLSSIAAVAVAPPLAFWLMRHGGWAAVCYVCAGLNILMGVIAWTIDEDASKVPAPGGHRRPVLRPPLSPR